MPSPKPRMTPQPIRLSDIQLLRLARARERDGIGIQEHIRRGIDAYLGWLEKEAIALGRMNPEDQLPQDTPKTGVRLSDLGKRTSRARPSARTPREAA